jgi:hypothetical protein
MALSEYADWWDKKKRDSERILTEWVQDAMVGFTDRRHGPDQQGSRGRRCRCVALRRGNGSGRSERLGKDGTPFADAAGPTRRAGSAGSRFLTPLIRSGNLRFAVQVAGVDGPCTFQAVNNAVSIANGRSLFVTVADMASAVGKRLTSLTKKAAGDSTTSWACGSTSSFRFSGRWV